MADNKTNKKSVVSKDAVVIKTSTELQDELVELRTRHLESRKSHRAGELVNPHVLTTQRRAIARVMTALNAAGTNDVDGTIAPKEAN